MDAAHPPQAGHNGGLALDEPEPDASWRLWCWRRARQRAWSVPREVALRRLARAEELGMTYSEYSLKIMERGKYLECDAAQGNCPASSPSGKGLG